MTASKILGATLRKSAFGKFNLARSFFNQINLMNQYIRSYPNHRKLTCENCKKKTNNSLVSFLAM
jgi:hypothetical protein